MKSFKNDILENGNNENKKVNTFPKDFRKHLKDLTRKYKSFKKEKEKKENPITDESKENIKEKIITTNNSHLTSEISILRENTQRNDTNEYYNIKSYKNSFEGQNFSFQKFNYLQTDKPETLKNYEQYKNILEQKICELKKKLSNENNKNNFEEIRKIKINKFIEINKINIKANPFITFIQMLDSKDLYSLFRTCKEIKQLIINALIFEVKTFISNKFEQLSKGVFSNNIYLLCFHTYYENQNKYLQIFLIIKSKLTSKMLCNKSVHLQYYANFPYDKSEYVLSPNYDKSIFIKIGQDFTDLLVQCADGDFIPLGDITRPLPQKGICDLSCGAGESYFDLNSPYVDYRNYDDVMYYIEHGEYPTNDQIDDASPIYSGEPVSGGDYADESNDVNSINEELPQENAAAENPQIEICPINVG